MITPTYIIACTYFVCIYIDHAPNSDGAYLESLCLTIEEVIQM